MNSPFFFRDLSLTSREALYAFNSVSSVVFCRMTPLTVYSGQETCLYSAPQPPSCFVPLRCGKEDDLLFLSLAFRAWLTGLYFTERCSLSSHNGSPDHMLASSFKPTPRCSTPPFSSVSCRGPPHSSIVKTQESHGF